MKKTMIYVLVIVLCIALFTACGSAAVSGRYAAQNGDAYDFNGHGGATVTIDGETIEGYTYATSGTQVYVYEPDYDHESGDETDNILTVSGETLTDKDGIVFTKEN